MTSHTSTVDPAPSKTENPSGRTVGIILAGGTGERLGLRVPKQLVKVSGKPVIQHTLEAFEFSSCIDEIIVMMAPGYVDDARRIVTGAAYQKVRAVLEGGGTRSETTRRAIDALG